MEDGFFSYAFVQRALAAGLLAGASCGLGGVFVVLLRISFVGVCVSHAAMAGALGAIFLGLPPLPGAILISLGAAGAISPLAEKGSMSADTATGVIFSIMLSLSMLALGLLPGARTDGLGLLWGNILTVTRADLALLCVVSASSVCGIRLFFKEIQSVLCHRDAALASGIPAGAISQGMLLLLGLIVAAGIKAVGGLLIYSLIITPAVAAYQLTYSLKLMFLLSAVFGMLSCWAGICGSYLLGWPSGACIVLCAAAILIAALLAAPKRKSLYLGGSNT